MILIELIVKFILVKNQFRKIDLFVDLFN